MGFFDKLKGNQQAATQPKFVVKRQTPSGTYEVYKGGSAESARAFLATKRVTQSKYYIKVETPEGNWGMDLDGLYLERLVPFQSNIPSAQSDGSISGMPAGASLKYASKNLSDNFIVQVKCGKCGREWQDGLLYKKATIVKCPQCKSLNKVDSSPNIVEIGGMLSFRVEV